MIETLLPLSFPPGLQNSGTTYQSKGRWHAGNCIRFYGGNVEPIGGWVRRTLTGAPIVGTPNAAVSWQTNEGLSFLAVGTTTNLYVVSGSVVYDITPTNVIGDGLTHRWQLEIFGTYLMAAFNRTKSFAGPNNLYAWNGVIGTIAATTTLTWGCPTAVFGLVVTPERFLVLLRGADVGTVNGGLFVPTASRID